MSHVTAVELKILDIDALEMACGQLGINFMRNQKTHKWFGRFLNDWSNQRAAVKMGYDTKKFGTCDHAIKLPGVDYEIGLVQMPGGEYSIVYDVWGSGAEIERQLGGIGLPKLKQEYAVAVATKHMLAQGMIVQRGTTEHGLPMLVGVNA